MALVLMVEEEAVLSSTLSPANRSHQIINGGGNRIIDGLELQRKAMSVS
jgi:hypothetical protein